MTKKHFNNFLYYISYHPLLKFPRRIFLFILDSFFYILASTVNFYDSHDTLKKVNRLKNHYKPELRLNECYFLHHVVSRYKNLKGAMVEVGVYNGGSAMIMNNADSKKTLWLYDTFTGLVDVGPQEYRFKNGMYKTSYERIKRMFKGMNCELIKGDIRHAKKLPKSISICHIDVDTYSSTLGALEKLWSRIIDKGIIIIHDYVKDGGAKTALDEFAKKKGLVVLNPVGAYGMVIK